MLKKKGRCFYLFQEILGNLYDRTRIEVISMESMESMGRQGWLYWFFVKQKRLKLLNTHFVVRNLKLIFIPNFSQIGVVKWPRVFEKSSKVTDCCFYVAKRLQNIAFNILKLFLSFFGCPSVFIITFMKWPYNSLPAASIRLGLVRENGVGKIRCFCLKKA